MPDFVVLGQRVKPEKVQLAKDLRHRMQPAEGVLWGELRRNQLGGWHFRRQQLIDGFIVDFYCHQAALVVELDGKVHEFQAGYDRDRDQVLGLRGIRVLRVPNERVTEDLPALLLEIDAACLSGRTEKLARNRT